jgi:hypothetical protein
MFTHMVKQRKKIAASWKAEAKEKVEEKKDKEDKKKK